MPEKKVSTPAADAPAAEGKTRKSAKAPTRRGRPPLAPELYVEMGGEQYNITDIIDRAKADYRTTHKVGVQSCKVYVKPEEGAAYYVINKFSGKLDLYFFTGSQAAPHCCRARHSRIRLHQQKKTPRSCAVSFLHRQRLRTPASAKGSYALRPGPGLGSRIHNARWR